MSNNARDHGARRTPPNYFVRCVHAFKAALFRAPLIRKTARTEKLNLARAIARPLRPRLLIEAVEGPVERGEDGGGVLWPGFVPSA